VFGEVCFQFFFKAAIASNQNIKANNALVDFFALLRMHHACVGTLKQHIHTVHDRSTSYCTCDAKLGLV
jgi:hypothetical protein